MGRVKKHEQRAKTSKRALAIFQRVDRVVELRAEGLTLAEISRELGIGRTTVWDDCTRAINAWQDKYAETWQELRFRQTIQLEGVLRGSVRLAQAGDKDAAATVVKVWERLSRLHGLDTDTAKASGSDGTNPYDGITEAERDRKIDELLERAGFIRAPQTVSGEVLDPEDAD